MRVGLVMYGDVEREVSGGNLYDLELVRHLRRQSHEVQIFSLPHASYVRHLTDNLTRELIRELAAADVDVLLEDELAHPSLFHLNRRLRRGTRYPIASVVHHLRSSEDHPEWQHRFYRLVEKRYLRTIDAFIFNSETTRESVESLLGEKTRSIVATPGGDRLGPASGPETIAERALESGPLRLLFVGNLIRRKGLHDLFAALVHLTDLEWTLDVVGNRGVDPSYVEELEEQSKAAGICSHLTFHGELSDETLRERYRESHVLVVPSSYEGFGMVYLEAMGFGLPVIAGAAGAADEVVSHEVTGFLVFPTDHGSFSRQLRRLAQDRDLLSRMSLAALQSFQQQPTWDDTTRAIEAFLLAITNASSRT